MNKDYEVITLPQFYRNPIITQYKDNKKIKEFYWIRNKKTDKMSLYEAITKKIYEDKNGYEYSLQEFIEKWKESRRNIFDNRFTHTIDLYDMKFSYPYKHYDYIEIDRKELNEVLND